MPIESSGAFISAPGVLRPPQMSHREVSAKGGRVKERSEKRSGAAQFGKGESGAKGSARYEIAGSLKRGRSGRAGRAAD
jgi:hypothetical protein